LRALAPTLRPTAAVGLRDRLAAYSPKAPALPVSAASKEVELLVRARQASFAGAKPDGVKGGGLFATHCAVCHSIQGRGGLAGPQLDGIGTRGADRLIEDVSDLRRNVITHYRIHEVTLRNASTAKGTGAGKRIMSCCWRIRLGTSSGLRRAIS
jgi:putative heme-binding domain-containing protein